MTQREMYDEMVRQVIAPELKQEGFRRTANRFGRWQNESWEVIDLQASQWGDRDGVRFTINLACAISGLPKYGNWPQKGPPSEALGNVRERIGTLMDGSDHWWDFDSSTDIAALANELLGLLRTVALPWLDDRAGLDRLLRLIADAPSDLGWHDLRALPKQLRDVGYPDVAQAVEAEASRRGHP